MVEWGRLRSAATQVPDNLSAALERMIADGTIPHGERLPAERELAAELGVSRTSLRDALRELELKGLVDRRPGRGTMVLEPGQSGVGKSMLSKLDRNERDLLEVMDLRGVIEPSITALAARRATPRDIRDLHQIIQNMEDGDVDQAPAFDAVFHGQIARATHNPLLMQLVEFASSWINETRPVGGFTEERRQRSLAAHRAILATIEARDPDAARDAMAEHIEKVSELLTTDQENS